jgi:stage II sporulation protein R
MFKLVKWLLLLALIGAAFYAGSVYSDKLELQDQVLRLHVVADSDSVEDQAVKLKVRDALLAELESVLQQVDTKAEAQTLIEGKLDQLQQVAQQVLQECGVTDGVRITLDREEFDTRAYDTFTLPAGVYDSLRVTIGSGEGKNWWCVVFPSLCVPAASEQVEDVAAGAGFSEELSGAITGEPKYQVRFFFLDCFGRLENFFW